MDHIINALGQPIGCPVTCDLPRPLPGRAPMTGQFCDVVPLQMQHAPALYSALAEDRDGRNWTYLPNGPYASLAAFQDWAEGAIACADPFMHAILVDGEPLGHVSFLRMAPQVGSIEVGFINYAPRLQRKPAATEAMYLMMARAFDELGYRRYEWKCDALNAPSRAAAQRLGFVYEGMFRQATVYKGRNRDTAWFSVIDQDWASVKAGFQAWLDPSNFDAAGLQRQSLSALRGGTAAP